MAMNLLVKWPKRIPSSPLQVAKAAYAVVSRDTLDVIMSDSNIPVPELLEYSSSMFYRAPVDRRNALEKLIDVFGIEYVYATLGVLALVSLVILLRSLSFYAIVNLGAGTIIKVVGISAYLVNLPINFINEFKKLQAEHQAALLEPIGGVVRVY